ncbi:MAG: UDP-N-acetylmuramate--L-alanine ligase [Clostridia bacterium]|nr:UDP-N-acetylmuramate--L-alanine ligase [Clostridia bacterium]
MATPNTHFGAENIELMLKDCKSIYFIGIGGINMSSLAHISHLRGYRVGGSDREKTALTERLKSEGIEIFYGHAAENIESYDAAVYTVAISPDNPEYMRVIERGIPCISRADYLGYLMLGYENRIGVSGMHGKSTCTSMCATVFMAGGADPTVLSGAELDAMGGAYRIGESENFIFEACEYMDSFLDFNPSTAIILNIEMDHVDYFKSMEQIYRSYSDFAAITGESGTVIANADDTNIPFALENYGGRVVTFGVKTGSADYTAINIRYPQGFAEFDVMHKGEFAAHVKLSVTGEHNIYNALAAFAAGHISGLEPERIAEGLKAFGGAKRRMEYKGRVHGALVFDDYGHHPTEVATTLEGVAKRGAERVICVFQPHTFSRTFALMDDFARSFDAVNAVYVADIYPARETDNLGISGKTLAKRIGDKAEYVSGFENIARELNSTLREGDILVVMGAGDIYKVFDYLNFDR